MVWPESVSCLDILRMLDSAKYGGRSGMVVTLVQRAHGCSE